MKKINEYRKEAEMRFVGNLYNKPSFAYKYEYDFVSMKAKFFYILLVQGNFKERVTQTELESFIKKQSLKIQDYYRLFDGWETIEKYMNKASTNNQKEHYELLKTLYISKEMQDLIDGGFISDDDYLDQSRHGGVLKEYDRMFLLDKYVHARAI